MLHLLWKHNLFILYYESTKQALRLRNFIKDLKIVDNIARPNNIFYDNSTTILFRKNNKSRSRSKLIDIKYLSVRASIKRHEVSIEHISIELMILDLITKSY